jgi:hypothetical protein
MKKPLVDPPKDNALHKEAVMWSIIGGKIWWFILWFLEDNRPSIWIFVLTASVMFILNEITLWRIKSLADQEHASNSHKPPRDPKCH